MARDVNKRLDQLRTRRAGLDRLDRLSVDEQRIVFDKSLHAESWQKRAQNQPNTQYALGAMQEVGPEYTAVSLKTAERVQGQLESGFAKAGFCAEYRLQGSVPLNVHIRGVSDVDLLTIDTSF